MLEGRAEELRLDGRARFPRDLLKNLLVVAVNERVAVAHEYGKRHPHSHIRGGAGDRLRFLDRRHGPVKAGVVRHHRACAAARRASEGGESAEIGVDRGHRGEAEKPGLERLAGRAKRGRREGAGVIMRIDQRRHRQKSSRALYARRLDRGDAAVANQDIDRRTRRTAVGRQKDDPGKRGDR